MPLAAAIGSSRLAMTVFGAAAGMRDQSARIDDEHAAASVRGARRWPNSTARSKSCSQCARRAQILQSIAMGTRDPIVRFWMTLGGLPAAERG
jgi:hypothetical protein